MRVHLIGGILKTVCGKELEEVRNTLKVDDCTCKSCLKQKHPTYPKLIHQSHESTKEVKE